LVQSLGGELETLYFAFGDTDVYMIIDSADNTRVAAAALAAGATGAVSTKTTVLLTCEEIDAAVKLAPSYRPPGT
ncbi:MAG: GYD domain-containing protein, partial [Betaproteobacteria bacterium]|nr:GYD domain-containing protein [Betaproteobacteria bacterium]